MSEFETPNTTPGTVDQQLEQMKIELDPDTYGALLDRIAELEAMATHQPASHQQKSGSVDLDDLVDEVRRAGQNQQTEQVDLDQMTNKQLAQFIFQQINEQGGARIQQLETTVETLKVIREIDKCESKYSDFWQFEDRIKQLGVSNPTLSIEQAYKLAKAEAPPQAKKAEQDDSTPRPTRTERLLKLPSRMPHSEKPGPAVGSMRDSNPLKTLTDAASKAWDEVVGKDKVVI